MKVILRKDLKGVGRSHDVIEVSGGYALNHLIPKGFAVAATPTANKEADMRRKQMTDRSALDTALLAQNIASLAEARIVIKAKVNEKDHLYNAVGESEILIAAKEQAHIDLPEGAIKLEKAIKKVGTFDIPIAVGEVFGKFSIIIEAE